MKKVVFILGRYLPQASANGICVENIIKKLIVRGYDVTCISYKDQNKLVSKHGEKVIRIDRGIIHNILYKNEQKTSKYCKLICFLANFIIKIKQLLLFFATPLSDPIFTYKVYRAVEKEYKESEFDYIIPIHMPLSSIIVGNRIKKKYPQIKYIPYFLDSLSGGIFPKYIPNYLSLKNRLKWEDRLLSNADKIICMKSSEAHHKKYNFEKTFFKRMIFLDIPLLTPVANQYSVESDKKIINIIFTGLANYPLRNIPYLLDIFKKISRKDIKLTFIGNTNREDIFNQAKKENNLNIEYIEFISHDRLRYFLQKADILLNIGVNTPSAISGKIFEYMSYGKPIISTYSIDNEACIPYLEKYPLSYMIDERITDLELQANKLNLFIEECKNKRISAENIINEFYLNTPDAFINIIEAL